MSGQLRMKKGALCTDCKDGAREKGKERRQEPTPGISGPAKLRFHAVFAQIGDA
jgi:hypothetical protein